MFLFVVKCGKSILIITCVICIAVIISRNYKIILFSRNDIKIWDDCCCLCLFFFLAIYAVTIVIVVVATAVGFNDLLLFICCWVIFLFEAEWNGSAWENAIWKRSRKKGKMLQLGGFSWENYDDYLSLYSTFGFRTMHLLGLRWWWWLFAFWLTLSKWKTIKREIKWEN